MQLAPELSSYAWFLLRDAYGMGKRNFSGDAIDVAVLAFFCGTTDATTAPVKSMDSLALVARKGCVAMRERRIRRGCGILRCWPVHSRTVGSPPWPGVVGAPSVAVAGYRLCCSAMLRHLRRMRADS